MTSTPQQLLRAPVFHTPRNPFLSEAALEAFSDGGLLIGNGRVIACGDYAALHAQYPQATVRDLRSGFLLPGLVDTHIHFPQIRILGSLGLGLLDWLNQHALPEEARLADQEYARAVAREFVHALAAHGTTTALVFGAHFQFATAALFETAARSGLRVVSGLVVSDRQLRPELHQTPEAAYSASKDLIRSFHGKGRLLYAVTPRFALSTTEAMLEMCQSLLREHPDVRFQTHLNENSQEVSGVLKLFPWAKDYLGVYERYDLVGRGRYWHTTYIQPTTSCSGSLRARQASPTVRAATRRWEADGFRCAVTFTPVYALRWAQMLAVEPALGC